MKKIRREVQYEVYMMLFFGAIGVIYGVFYALFPKELQAVKYGPQTVGMLSAISLAIVAVLLPFFAKHFFYGGILYVPKTVKPLSSKKIVYQRTDIEEGCPVDNEREQEWWSCIMRHKKRLGICNRVFAFLLFIVIALLPLVFLFLATVKGTTVGSVISWTVFCLFALGVAGLGFSMSEAERWDYTSIELRPLIEYHVKKNIVSGTFQKEKETEDFAYNTYYYNQYHQNDCDLFYDLEDGDKPFIAHYWWNGFRGKKTRVHLPKSMEPKEPDLGL